MDAFFAKRNKKKKQFVLKEKRTANKTTEVSKSKTNTTKNATATASEVASGWVEEDNKPVINTSGKGVMELGETEEEEKEFDEAALNAEEAKNAFHWARQKAKKKPTVPSVPVETAPKPTGLRSMGWRDRERMKQSQSQSIMMSSESHFPELGGKPSSGSAAPAQKPKGVTVSNMWTSFQADDEDEDEEEEDEDGDMDEAQEDKPAEDAKLGGESKKSATEDRKTTQATPIQESSTIFTSAVSGASTVASGASAQAQPAEGPSTEPSAGTSEDTLPAETLSEATADTDRTDADRFAGLKKKKKKKKKKSSEEAE